MRVKRGLCIGSSAALLLHVMMSLTWGADGKGGPRGMCGPPPPAKPQRQSGGEGKKAGGGLSKLPCAPTRRTEKKSPPAPTTLVAKLSYANNQDWQTDRNDVFNLLKLTRDKFGVPFRPWVVTFDQFSFDPAEVPVMYITGHNGFKFEPEHRRRLRTFIERGGTLIVDCCCGSEAFGVAAKKELRSIFPDRRFKTLPQDHPVFHCSYSLDRIRYSPLVKDQPEGRPYLEGIEMGCRTAAFYSKYDLSCGWDSHSHPHSKGVLLNDAVKLGVNMLTYALVSYKGSSPITEARGYLDANSESRGKVVLAQIKYAGEWNRHVAATQNLLAGLGKNFPAEVKFARTDLELTDPKMFSYPLLYLTGHDDFQLAEPEVEALRKYLTAGGFLLGESCCGRQAFDRAFRRELKKVLPDGELAAARPDHPVYKMCYAVTDFKPSGFLAQKLQGAKLPPVEVIDLKGNGAVLYSRFGLSCGWAEEQCPYCLGYESPLALQLGVNMLAYALSH